MLQLITRGFDVAIHQFVQQDVQQEANIFKRKVALDLLKAVILNSPVDTGRYRGNWQVELNGAAIGEIEITKEDDPGGGVTLESGSAVISKADFGDDIWLVNNVPYAVALEDGHSGQAPRGVLSISVFAVEQTL